MSQVIEMRPKPKFYAVAAKPDGVERTPEFATKDELMRHLSTEARKTRWTICRRYVEERPATRETITGLRY